jgi:hypothetical protein
MRRNGRPLNAGGQRFGIRQVFGLLLVAVFGGGLLFAGVRMWHDHSVLGTRGVTTTAVITHVHSGRGGPSVDVRFTATDGREVQARVQDADSPAGLNEGSPIDVRYDPLDPQGRIESARNGHAAGTRWLLIVGGGLLLCLAAYGAGWWGWYAWRRH